MRPTRLLLLLLAAALAVVAVPADALGFGTVNGYFGQNGEHERMTRAALACPAGTPSDGTCFEPLSLAQVAGDAGTFGAVGAPDFPPPEGSAAHCDDGDFLDPSGTFPLVRSYPTRIGNRTRALAACRAHATMRRDQGLDAAAALLDAKDRIDPAGVDLASSCTFLGGLPGRAKCNVFDGFGRMLHAVQDFYAHTNWVDGAVPASLVTITNPPGLGNGAPAAVMNLRTSGAGSIPANLMSGCFSLYEKGLSPVDGCSGRVTHGVLNKDQGTIDPLTGAASAPTTPRGLIGTNFSSAVTVAIADTRRQWEHFRAELIVRYGAPKANLMICTLTHDDPVKACQGRKLAIVVDSSGSNTETDPDDLRIAAASSFNSSLVSAAQAGSGPPDRSAVIDFDDSARVISPLGDPAAASFAGIDSSGGTSIAGGVRTATAELTRDPADPTAGRSGIVVLTDGEDSDVASLVAAIGEAGALGIRVSFGFLAPPSNPVPASPKGVAPAVDGLVAVPSSRSLALTAPAPELVNAILATGGIYSVIDSASAQQAFVQLVRDRGATALDDPNGADDGGPITSGVSVTGTIADPNDVDTYSFEVVRGREVLITVQPLAGQPLAVTATDVRAGTTYGPFTPGTSGKVELDGHWRSNAELEVQVSSPGGAGTYGLGLVQRGVDLLGTGRNDRLRCSDEPTYVVAGAGNDVVTCGAGDDMILGGPGADQLLGKGGDDIVVVAGKGDLRRGVEVIDGGKGRDVVWFSFPYPRGQRCGKGRTDVVLGRQRGWIVRNVEKGGIRFTNGTC